MTPNTPTGGEPAGRPAATPGSPHGTHSAGTTTAITHISTLVTNEPSLGEGPLGLIQDAALVIDGDRIADRKSVV